MSLRLGERDGFDLGRRDELQAHHTAFRGRAAGLTARDPGLDRRGFNRALQALGVSRGNQRLGHVIVEVDHRSRRERRPRGPAISVFSLTFMSMPPPG